MLVVPEAQGGGIVGQLDGLAQVCAGIVKSTLGLTT